MKLEKVIAVRTDKTVYRDGDLAIKVFGSDYDKADILNEALNQARVEETGLNVPQAGGGLQDRRQVGHRHRLHRGQNPRSASWRRTPTSSTNIWSSSWTCSWRCSARPARMLNKPHGQNADRKIAEADLDATTPL